MFFNVPHCGASYFSFQCLSTWRKSSQVQWAYFLMTASSPASKGVVSHNVWSTNDWGKNQRLCWPRWSHHQFPLYINMKPKVPHTIIYNCFLLESKISIFFCPREIWLLWGPSISITSFQQIIAVKFWTHRFELISAVTHQCMKTAIYQIQNQNYRLWKI